MSVRSTLGKIGQERGRENEERTFRVLTSYSVPAWFLKIDRATFEEDQDGIDFVVHSDVGKLFLQIKSSETGRMNARNPKNKAIVVINAKMSDEEVQAKLLAALGSVRDKFLKMRGQL